MRRLVPVSLVLLLLAAACGGGTGTEEAEAPAQTEAPAEEEPAGTPPISLSGPVNFEGNADESGAGSSFSLDMEQADFSFEPTFVEAAPGAQVTVELHNEGDAQHTFTIDALDVDEVVDAGETAEVTVELPDEGPVRFTCRFHEAQGMQGSFYFEAATGGVQDGGTGGGDGRDAGSDSRY